MKRIGFILLFFAAFTAKSQVYLHDFGATAISAFPYSVSPAILNTNLSLSSWTNSVGAWTSYAGSSGEAIALSNSGGTPTITLTFSVANGYNLTISSFDFWRLRSATGAQNWSMTINGIAVGAGTIPTTGAALGTTVVSNPVNSLRGTVTVVLSLSAASGTGTFRIDDFTLNGTVQPNAFVLLDNFNRNDTIRPAIPSSGGPAWWVEIEPGWPCHPLETIRIKNNLLEQSGCDLSNSICYFSPTNTASMTMTGKYPTVFANAASTMEWYFNMQQSRADPNGFGSGEYGVAFVLGANTNNPDLTLTKYGYAVIFGESGSTDPVRLVSYNGTAFNSTTFSNIISVASPPVKTNFMSVKVTYNPCTNEWSLTVRDDGSSFADPITISGLGGTAVNSTFVNADLFWLGTVWNHPGSCALSKFDNIYIPNTGTNTGSYIWKGTVNSDFQLAQNWSPLRQCIKTTDKLLFNSSSPVSSVVTNVPDQIIAQLTVSNSRTLDISDVAGDGIASTLTISGATGTDLQVDPGCSIIFNGSTASAGDAVVIDLGAAATATIAGTISFYSQFGGTKAHRLTAQASNGIVVNSGGIVKALNLSGNPFGNSGPANTVVFNTGSVYEYYSGSNPFALAQPASKVVFNTGSTYKHFSNIQPSLLGRVYADMEYTGSANVSLGGTAFFTVNNFKMLSGTLQFTGASNSQPVHTNIKGNLLVSPGAVFSYDPVSSSTLEFNGSTAQSISSSGTLVFGKQLTVRLNSSYATAPQLSVQTNTDIAGVLDIVQGTLRLNADINMRSTINGTASIAPITGAITYGAGRFIIERYIPNHPKAWQFLAVPTQGQTVNAAWQEGNAPMVIGNAGSGTIITSNVAGTGFDVVGGYGPSMKTFDTTGAGTWKGITRTDTAIYNKKGYMLFVRGDRSVVSSAALPTETTLRTKGTIFDAASLPPVTSIGKSKFESVGNPYASTIDFSNEAAVLKSANVQRIFYVWDPNLGSGPGYGGFQTFVKGMGSDYYVSPGGGSYGAPGSVNNTIQSGQAFFVHTFGGTGTVSFTENAKIAGSSIVNRVIPHFNQQGQLRTNLYLGSGSNAILMDGILNEFSIHYSNNIDVLDALKAENTNESIGIFRNGSLLAVERNAAIRPLDSIPLNLQRLRIQQYEFEFMPTGIAKPGLTAYLVDHFLQSYRVINLNNNSHLGFVVSADAGSADPNRFVIVFKQQKKPIWKEEIAVKNITDKFISIYPNPVSNTSITVSHNLNAGSYQLLIFNPAGQQMLSRSIQVKNNGQAFNFSLASLNSGSYLLVLSDGAGLKLNREFLVQNNREKR